jgi:hypothetical protein
MSTILQQVKELIPKFFALAGMKERLGIPNQDHGVTSSGKEDIQTLWRRHETNVMIRIASRESDDDYVILFSLIIVCEKEKIN